MAIQDSTFPLQDALFCDEPQLEHDDDVYQSDADDSGADDSGADDDELRTETSSFPALNVTEEDLRWSDDELAMLLSKEIKEERRLKQRDLEGETAVEWMMRVVAHYGFNALTAVLAVDYFDRFMFSHHRHLAPPWTVQLTAVACLSLAAKVEETQAFLVLDLQVEGAKFMFESKTVQRMELLVLSTLQWRMHPVTPFSFIDHFIRRLGLKPNLQLDFQNKASRILTSLITNSKWGLYQPSALASATMLHVMECCSNSIDDQNQLFSAFISINKEKVSECYKQIHELNITSAHQKRKFTELPLPGSPKAVIDTYLSNSDSSNDSWSLNLNLNPTSSTTMLQPPPSSSELPALKRLKYDSNHSLILEANGSNSSLDFSS
ncbi:unnamed protein product [Rhodiola kirilowii]